MKRVLEQVGNAVRERFVPRTIQEAMAQQMFEVVNPRPYNRWEIIDQGTRDAYMQLANAAYYAAKQWQKESKG